MDFWRKKVNIGITACRLIDENRVFTKAIEKSGLLIRDSIQNTYEVLKIVEGDQI